MVKIGKNWLIDLIQGIGPIIFGLCAKAGGTGLNLIGGHKMILL